MDDTLRLVFIDSILIESLFSSKILFFLKQFLIKIKYRYWLAVAFVEVAKNQSKEKDAEKCIKVDHYIAKKKK